MKTFAALTAILTLSVAGVADAKQKRSAYCFYTTATHTVAYKCAPSTWRVIR